MLTFVHMNHFDYYYFHHSLVHMNHPDYYYFQYELVHVDENRGRRLRTPYKVVNERIQENHGIQSATFTVLEPQAILSDRSRDRFYLWLCLFPYTFHTIEFIQKKTIQKKKLD